MRNVHGWQRVSLSCRYAIPVWLCTHALADFYCALHADSCGLPTVSGELDLPSVSPRGNRTACAWHDRFVASRVTIFGTAVVGLIEQAVVCSYMRKWPGEARPIKQLLRGTRWQCGFNGHRDFDAIATAGTLTYSRGIRLRMICIPSPPKDQWRLR